MSCNPREIVIDVYVFINFDQAFLSYKYIHGTYIYILYISTVITTASSEHEEVMTWKWWRHPMETFSTLLALCEGNSPVIGKFPSQRPATRCFDVFFDLYMNKRLRKQPRRQWFETPSHSLCCHCNGTRPQYLSLVKGIHRWLFDSQRAGNTAAIQQISLTDEFYWQTG